MQEKANKSQNVRLAEILRQLKNDVTPADRKEASELKGWDLSTISRYLNGQVQNNDTAVTMITFFQNRIAERDKAIA